jgi:hypothetical protein
VKIKKTIKMALGLTVFGWLYEIILVESFPLWLPWFCGYFGGLAGNWFVQVLVFPIGKLLFGPVT